MQIGFVGLGKMGQVLVPRLLDAGYAVMVWNRTAERAQPLVERGAVQAESLPALASACDVVCCIVFDDAAVEAVYHTETGLLAGEVAGTLFIEMSTIRPDTVLRILPPVVERGATLIDAPVSGTLQPAREGRLMTMVGGEPADLERARPVLEVWSRRIAHIGPAGTGALMKLVLNMPMAIYWQALSEALAIGSQAGLDLRQMLDLIVDSPAAINALKFKMSDILGDTSEVSFHIDGVRKDLIAMTTAAGALGIAAPTAHATLLAFTAAAHEKGNEDIARFIPYYINLVRQQAEEPDADPD